MNLFTANSALRKEYFLIAESFCQKLYQRTNIAARKLVPAKTEVMFLMLRKCIFKQNNPTENKISAKKRKTMASKNTLTNLRYLHEGTTYLTHS